VAAAGRKPELLKTTPRKERSKDRGEPAVQSPVSFGIDAAGYRNANAQSEFVGMTVAFDSGARTFVSSNDFSYSQQSPGLAEAPNAEAVRRVHDRAGHAADDPIRSRSR
jgi:hypothetical protein